MSNAAPSVPQVPDVSSKLPRLGSAHWSISLNLSWILAALVVLYAIRTWKQESSCNCELSALKKQQSETR